MQQLALRLQQQQQRRRRWHNKQSNVLMAHMGSAL
jgi:hypothetical protein